MGPLTIRLFGTCAVADSCCRAGIFPTQKSKGLFAFLVLNRDRLHRRETLLGMFWGDRPDAVARKYLRTDLWRLRQVLEPPGTPPGAYLILEGHCVGFNRLSSHSLDVEEFENRIKTVGDTPGSQLTAEASHTLEEAVALYSGDLLAEIYDEWCVYDRERYRSLLRWTLERLMHYHQERENWEVAIRYAQRLLGSDPLLEHVHRDLMRFHYAMGNRPSALRQFELCARLLQQEFQVAPMPETVALYEDIVAGREPSGTVSRPPIPQRQSPTNPVDRALANLHALAKELEAARIALQRGIHEVNRLRSSDHSPPARPSAPERLVTPG